MPISVRPLDAPSPQGLPGGKGPSGPSPASPRTDGDVPQGLEAMPEHLKHEGAGRPRNAVPDMAQFTAACQNMFKPMLRDMMEKAKEAAEELLNPKKDDDEDEDDDA